MFGYQYHEDYSHSMFGFFMMGSIVFIFFIIAFIMTFAMQESAFGVSSGLLGLG